MQQKEINKKRSEVLDLLSVLNSTDYVSIKKSEGYEVDETIMADRKEARIQINVLESEIKVLEKELSEIEPLKQNQNE